MTLPYLTADLPGTGGVLRTRDEDFEVDEQPAYLPSGEGDHVFVHVEKRGITTLDAGRALARAAGVFERDVGHAGLKDKRAVARQWFSLPAPADVERMAALELDGIRVLAAARHRNKLRTGHLIGNRFRLRVRDLGCDPAEATRRATAIFARLDAAPGAPNWYGEQRFGHAGDNARIGRAILRGDGGPRMPRGRERRLHVSALQSELFNDFLLRRVHDGLYRRVIAGDVLARTESGGQFASTDPVADQVRLEAGEVVVTGPMYGHDMRRPAEGSEAARREDEVLADAELTLEAFRPLGKLAPGTRRALSIRPEGPEATADGDHLVLAFTLPPGAYATVIAREILKTDGAP
jgi:tRNA pseudouridine13 synthase